LCHLAIAELILSVITEHMFW